MDAGRPDPSLHDLPLRMYSPRPTLRVPAHDVPAARVPAVDAHNHLGRWIEHLGWWIEPEAGWAASNVPSLLALMDACNVRAIVNLDGRWGKELEANLERYDHAYPGRFATFCHPDWSVTSVAGFDDRLAAGIEHAAASGAKGVKVWKDLGLRIVDDRGEVLMPDDERLVPMWLAAGERDLPVLIHVADPLAFFEPVDRHNERLEELLANPDWSVADPRSPSFSRIIDALEAVVASSPGTTFIGAHVGCFAEDLAWVSRMIETYPNFHVDIAARIAELGRQPRAARRMVVEHPDRVLFGTDLTPDAGEYAIHFRFLETEDEHFAYSTEEIPPQGRWAISGLGLPDDVLSAVYSDNASRLIPGLGG